MTTRGSPDEAASAAGVSQEAIYDARYRRGRYDRRSAVPVLTAEWEAFGGALARAHRSAPGDEPLTVLDWGYGTGRVTNDVAVAYPHVEYDNGPKTFDRDLLVVAFDVSSVGLHRAAAALRAHGFHGADLSRAGGVLGELTRTRHGRTVTVRFVHGGEDAAPAATERLLTNAGGPYLATVSWYSALGHIPGEQARVATLTLLGRVTDPRGELILSVSALGDLVEAQAEWAERLRAGDVGGFPIEMPGDVVYDTEIGQRNYYHVFGPELAGLMDRTRTDPDQRLRMVGIRCPDEEFESRAAERDNYDRVRELNAECRRSGWHDGHYRRLHTVAAVRAFADVLPGDPDDRLTGAV
jgi:hypothetical protein